jgi:DNA-damage-inducible protein J
MVLQNRTFLRGVKIMASTIQVRVDDELKRKSDMLFRDLGTDTTSAIRMFLTQAVANNGFPFEIKKNSRVGYNPYEPMNEKEILEKLQCSREHCEEGRCREADKVVSDLRGKYGL